MYELKGKQFIEGIDDDRNVLIKISVANLTYLDKFLQKYEETKEKKRNRHTQVSGKQLKDTKKLELEIIQVL